MRNILLILLFPVSLFSCSKGGHVDITINVSNKRTCEIKLFVQDKEYMCLLDESGRAVKTITIPEETYAYVVSRDLSFTIYLQPNKNIDISYDATDRSKRVFLYCDDNGINSYLSTERNFSNESFSNSHRLNEKSYIQKLKTNIERRKEYLASKKLPLKFAEIEKERISYDVIKDIFFYPLYRKFFSKNKSYKPSNMYNNFLDSMFVQKPELLQLYPYRNFIVRYVEKKILGGGYSNDAVQKELDYIVENVNNPEISDFLVNTFVYDYIESNGLEGNIAIINRYKEIINDDGYKENFIDLVERYKNLQQGKLAPDFSLKNINGKTVSLADFKGKYIYIYVWATWDSRSRKENRYFKTLVNEYKGKDISFVSVSLDYNKSQWQNYIKRMRTPGLHLYADNNEAFPRDYLITKIPRFILIDKDSRIISSYAKGSSDKNIRKVLNRLLEI